MRSGHTSSSHDTVVETNSFHLFIILQQLEYIAGTIFCNTKGRATQYHTAVEVISLEVDAPRGNSRKAHECQTQIKTLANTFLIFLSFYHFFPLFIFFLINLLMGNKKKALEKGKLEFSDLLISWHYIIFTRFYCFISI